ncbi:MAG: hypothetical protein LBT39_03140 [Treponema sp.]|jgi:hemerythrin-like metal-binding protein|nr:hypothetical protein [Treponema sp.]
MGYHVVEWESRYSVGIESIDEQHKQIITVCNNLCLNCHREDENSREFFHQGMSGLIRFLQYHFLVEEQLLERIDFPELSFHKDEHLKAQGFFKRYLACLGTEDELPLKRSILLIQKQVIRHITEHDHKYANYIHAMHRHAPWYVRDGFLPTELFLG